MDDGREIAAVKDENAEHGCKQQHNSDDAEHD
jgi:hypothetical protein